MVLAEAALRMGPRPSYVQQLLLFQLVAGLTIAGVVLFHLWKHDGAMAGLCFTLQLSQHPLLV